MAGYVLYLEYKICEFHIGHSNLSCVLVIQCSQHGRAGEEKEWEGRGGEERELGEGPSF